MRVIEDAWRGDGLPQGCVATIGNYDGIHRGQRAVIDQVTARAAELELPAVLVTFEPHPRSVLQPERPPRLLTTAAQKRRLLATCGIDCLALLAFDAELAATPAEVFVERFLVGRLGVREVVVGSRFGFGHRGGGDLALLQQMSVDAGFKARGIDELMHEGAPVSSTRIRAAVAAGSVVEASALLGRPFALEGRIVRGDGRGRTIGFPTANLAPDNELLPANGVYATTLAVAGEGEARPGVANVGTRPTVDGSGRVSVEAHVFDFDGDLYERRAELAFHCRLRDERRFESVEELRQQIDRDARAGREYFSSRSCSNQGTAV